MERIITQTAEAVLRDGHVVNYMGPDVAADAPYGYTTGRALAGRPDLLISGPFDPLEVHALLDHAVLVDQETPLAVGQRLTIHNRDLLVGECITLPLHASAAMFGPGRFEALQLLWPAPNGAFPGMLDYDTPSTVQTIYGDLT